MIFGNGYHIIQTKRGKNENKSFLLYTKSFPDYTKVSCGIQKFPRLYKKFPVVYQNISNNKLYQVVMKRQYNKNTI